MDAMDITQIDRTTSHHPTDDTLPASVVLLGGAGKTGQRVIDRLTALGVHARPASRSTDVPFDWEDDTTWRPALEGADAAYLTFQPDLAVPGADAAVGAVAALAAESGVRRLVLLSGRGEEGAQRAEQAALAHHPGATVVRCAWFAQNFSEGMFAEAVATGEIALPVPADVPEPFVDLDDVAEVATAALTQPGLAGRVHELTGPSALTFPEVAAMISAAWGREVVFAPVTPEEFAAGAVEAGLDEPTSAFLADLFQELTDGRNVAPTAGVRDALGRPARSFADYIRTVAAVR